LVNVRAAVTGSSRDLLVCCDEVVRSARARFHWFKLRLDHRLWTSTVPSAGWYRSRRRERVAFGARTCRGNKVVVLEAHLRELTGYRYVVSSTIIFNVMTRLNNVLLRRDCSNKMTGDLLMDSSNYVVMLQESYATTHEFRISCRYILEGTRTCNLYSQNLQYMFLRCCRYTWALQHIRI